MATFFLLLIIFFVVIPLFRAALAIFRVRRSARRFFDQFSSNGTSTRQSSQPRQPRPAAPAKKINPEDGEFVPFEDIPASPDNTDKANPEQRTTVIVEQQIVDVEWEDIK